MSYGKIYETTDWGESKETDFGKTYYKKAKDTIYFIKRKEKAQQFKIEVAEKIKKEYIQKYQDILKKQEDPKKRDQINYKIKILEGEKPVKFLDEKFTSTLDAELKSLELNKK